MEAIAALIVLAVGLMIERGGRLATRPVRTRDR